MLHESLEVTCLKIYFGCKETKPTCHVQSEMQIQCLLTHHSAHSFAGKLRIGMLYCQGEGVKRHKNQHVIEFEAKKQGSPTI